MPTSAIPTAATIGPTGSSQASDLRSEKWPKNGWITDEDTVAASTSPEAAAYE